MSSLNFPADIQQFLQQEVANGKFPSETDVVVAAVRHYRNSDGFVEPIARDSDVLNWDNLIPVPPDRPGGRLHARVTSAGRDTPLPADDPWAK